jgi:hypothetical protein
LPPLLFTLLFVVVSAAAIMLGLRRRSSHRSPHRSLRQLLLQFLSPESLVLFYFLFYSVIVIINMFICVSTLFVVANLDASMAVRKPLFAGFSSSPHDASLHSCSV